MKQVMKQEEKIGLYIGGGLIVTTIAILLLRGKAQAAPPAEICFLPQSLVMAIPEDDSPCTDDPTLIWGAAVLKEFASGIKATTLEEEAIPDNLRNTIVEQSPEILYLYGHGNTTVYTCQKCLIFFLSGGLNLDLVSGKYVHLLSCLTAQDLGTKIIDAGAKGYFGYWDEFLCVAKARPGSGRFVEAPFYGDIEIEVALLEGQRTLKTIYDRSVARHNNEIDYWQHNWSGESCDGARISEYEAQMLITVIIHNRDTLRYYPVTS